MYMSFFFSFASEKRVNASKVSPHQAELKAAQLFTPWYSVLSEADEMSYTGLEVSTLTW